MSAAFECYAAFEDVEGNFERGILASIASSTADGYSSRLSGFMQACRVRGIFDFVLNSPAERQAFEDVASDYVFGEIKAGSTMENLRCAIRKVHLKHRQSSTWTTREDTLEFVKGLRHQGGLDGIIRGVQARVILHHDHLVCLCRAAILHNKRYLARGFYIMYMGLLRHGHVRRIMRADFVFSRDPTHVKLWAWGYKTGSHTLEGSYHKIVGFREELELWINEKEWKWTDLMLEQWSEQEAVAFIKQYCASVGIVGFKVDIHCLRGSGVEYYENEVCLEQKYIRVLGRWSASSHRYETAYRSTLPPEELVVLAAKAESQETFIFDRNITYQRTFTDAEIAGLEARRQQIAYSHQDALANNKVPLIMTGVEQLFPGAVNALARLNANFPGDPAVSAGDELIVFEYSVMPFSKILEVLAPLRTSRREVWVKIVLVVALTFHDKESDVVATSNHPETWFGRIQGDRHSDDQPATIMFSHMTDPTGRLELISDEDDDHAVKFYLVPALPVYYISLSECPDPYAAQRTLKDRGSSAVLATEEVPRTIVKRKRQAPTFSQLVAATLTEGYLQVRGAKKKVATSSSKRITTTKSSASEPKLKNLVSSILDDCMKDIKNRE